MANIRKTPTKIIGFRVRDDMLEFFNSLENKNDFLVGLVADCSAFKEFKKEKAQRELENEPNLFDDFKQLNNLKGLKMSKKNELKDYILFFKRLSAERSLIADCKVGKIDCGVSPGFLLARERILDELENQFYKNGKIPEFV